MNWTGFSIVIAGALIAGAVFFTGVDSSSNKGEANADNVRTENGAQIVEITAKGGYSPRTSRAKVSVPTVLRFKTQSTYDCSSSIRIPSIGFSKILPASGNTDINLGSPSAGTLRGTCSMGMYSFEIEFKG